MGTDVEISANRMAKDELERYFLQFLKEYKINDAYTFEVRDDILNEIGKAHGELCYVLAKDNYYKVLEDTKKAYELNELYRKPTPEERVVIEEKIKKEQKKQKWLTIWHIIVEIYNVLWRCILLIFAIIVIPFAFICSLTNDKKPRRKNWF